jgi:SpoVK/Ycf46/Vps4 family AAA+-type ATPase
MDGLSQSDEMVFVLAATNLPWELDTAMLRRLEKRILVPLPGGEARLRMLQHLLPPEKYTGLDFEETVEKTAGYSGSDVRLVCKEAAMRPLRRLMSALDEEEGSSSDVSAGDVLFDLRAPFLFVDCSLLLSMGKEAFMLLFIDETDVRHGGRCAWMRPQVYRSRRRGFCLF